MHVIDWFSASFQKVSGFHDDPSVLASEHLFHFHILLANKLLYVWQFLSLPIEGAMSSPENYPRAVTAAFAVTALFNSLFGIVGCYVWGDRYGAPSLYILTFALLHAYMHILLLI